MHARLACPCRAATLPACLLPPGRVFRSRMEGSTLGVLESWRYVRGNSMAVRTSLRLPLRPPATSSPPGSGGSVPGAANGSAGGGGGGQEVVMFWFFDRMEALQRHVARGRVGGSLLQQIETGAKLAVATRLLGQSGQRVCRPRGVHAWAVPQPSALHVSDLNRACGPVAASCATVIQPLQPCLFGCLASCRADQRHVQKATRKDTQYIQVGAPAGTRLLAS